jgi:hypothetical protein
MILVRKMRVADRVYREMVKHGGEFVRVFISEYDWHDLMSELDTDCYKDRSYPIEWGVYYNSAWVKIGGVRIEPMPTHSKTLEQLATEIEESPDLFIQVED